MGSTTGSSLLKSDSAASSHHFFHSVIDAIDAHTVVVDSTGRIVAVNEAWRAFVARNGGRFPHVLEGAEYVKACETATGCPDDESIEPVLNAVLKGKSASSELAYACATPLGYKHFRAAIRGFEHESNRFAVITHHDITDVTHVAQLARISESRLRMIIESSPDCIMRVDADGNLLSINKAGLDMWEVKGLDAIRGGKVAKFVADEYKRVFMQDIADASRSELQSSYSTAGTREIEVIGLRGTRQTVEYRCVRLPSPGSAAPDADVLIVARDVTWRKSAEELRISAERREALAQLAGGIAHEFNSMLLAAATYLDSVTLEIDCHVDNQDAESLQPVGKAAALIQQAQSLSASLLELFAGPDVPHLSTLALNPWLDECTRRLAEALPGDMRVTCGEVPDDLVAIADTLALDQVVRILLSNAADATQGNCSVSVEAIHASGGAMNDVGEQRIEIRVSDDGPGVPERDRSRIFEPFFTTRSRSRRSGLGLAIASRLVEHQGGSLRYEPNQPTGSIFVISLRSTAVLGVSESTE